MTGFGQHNDGAARVPGSRDSGGAPAPSAATQPASAATQTASAASPPPEPEADEAPGRAAEGTPSADGAPQAQEAAGADGVKQLEQLTAKAEKSDEYLALAQRTQADFENYRKRAIRDAAAAQERGVAKLALALLPAVDNLDRALEAADAAAAASAAASVAVAGPDGGTDADNGGSSLVSGIKLVHADVIAALARVGIEPFSPKGEPFDPQYHEAIAQQPIEGAESGTVVEVYQRGYRLGESVLRPARVVVAQ